MIKHYLLGKNNFHRTTFVRRLFVQQCEIKIQDTRLTQQVSYPTGILIKGSMKSSLNNSEEF